MENTDNISSIEYIFSPVKDSVIEEMKWIKFALEEISGVEMDMYSTSLVQYFVGICHTKGISSRSIAKFAYGKRNLTKREIERSLMKLRQAKGTSISEAVKFVMEYEQRKEQYDKAKTEEMLCLREYSPALEK